ncbi:hypothetical protein Bcep1808_2270 [Burkholderia vietnamiensis G4]|uniref:Uncharacterized protein n=1 Tax=Burkholderia vietnamiensis (strain G4 / LMG 22486) TaxID=269482 RepID=A4JG66_BURVG|nr:hypothetical protein Bcep1808_2270 [Burkholderia vietnamiensis G4]
MATSRCAKPIRKKSHITTRFGWIKSNGSGRSAIPAQTVRAYSTHIATESPISKAGYQAPIRLIRMKTPVRKVTDAGVRPGRGRVRTRARRCRRKDDVPLIIR